MFCGGKRPRRQARGQCERWLEPGVAVAVRLPLILSLLLLLLRLLQLRLRLLLLLLLMWLLLLWRWLLMTLLQLLLLLQRKLYAKAFDLPSECPQCFVCLKPPLLLLPIYLELLDCE